MQPLSVQAMPVAPTSRIGRRPKHSFQLRTRPWEIQPFLIAPVLPGETMRNLLLQARVVTDPIKNRLLGWWCEYYFFYVKLRDLDIREDVENMILTPGFDMTAHDAAANVRLYHAGPGINWTQHCYDRVTYEWFRDEEQNPADFVISSGIYAAKVGVDSWMESAKLESVTRAEDHELPGVNTILPAHMAGWEAHYSQWEHMRALKLTDVTFEDWLRSFGVKAPKPDREVYRPELVRFIREWSYPVSAIDPTDGSAANAVTWSIAERADKDRFFKEPGFLFGVTVCRPKIYFQNQKGAAAMMLADAYSWLPAVLRDEVYTSLKEFDAGATTHNGPLGNTPTEDYWVDIRDLFVHGDQFVNFALTETDAGLVALPTASLQKQYPSATDADALFVGAANQVYQDGIVSLNIAGTQRDTT